MKRLASLTVIGLGLMCLSTAQAAPRLHDGFHLQLSAGFGYYHTSADVAGTDVSYSGVTIPAGLLLGGSIIPGLTVGGGFFLDSAPSPSYDAGPGSPSADFQQLVLGLGAYVDWYYNPASGLHFQFFAGWGGLETITDGGAGGSDPTGFITYLGGGYEWWITDELSGGVMGRLTMAPLSLSGVGYFTIAPAVVGTLTYH